jgi:nucleotide-binding universal stress UspA family protein
MTDAPPQAEAEEGDRGGGEEEGAERDEERVMARVARFKRILVGIDPAKSSSVIETVHYLADKLGAEVIVVYVALADTVVPGNERDGLPATSEEERVYEKLEKAVRTSFGESRTIPLKILHGDPAERLAEYAKFAHCDLVVVGSRHLGALASALFGSVSSGLLKRSDVPVLVLR